MAENDDNLSVALSCYPEGSTEVIVRQVFLGLTPAVLITPEYDESEDRVTLIIEGSQLDDLEELVDLLENTARVARAALEQDAQHG